MLRTILLLILPVVAYVLLTKPGQHIDALALTAAVGWLGFIWFGLFVKV